MPNVDVNGLSLHLIDEGQGPPLVFLHGFPLTHSMWDAQRRHFRDHYRVIIPDLRGFGRTLSQDDLVTMDQFADDVVAMLDAIKVEGRVTLCGLSMGGYIAFALLRRHAERLQRLVLCDTWATPDTPEAAETRRKMADRVLTDGPGVLIAATLHKMFGPKTNEQRPQVVDAVRNVILATSSRAIAAGHRGMAERPDSTTWLPEIRVPTLVVVGEADQMSPPEKMRELAEKIPNAEFVEIPNAGHLSPMENPTAFNTALANWLTATA